MASGRRVAAVACGHPATAETAQEVLEAGGNAFDAVIAAGFASAVVEPALTGLGGGGFLLARPESGPAVCFDFFTDTPGRGLPPRELAPHFLPVTVHFPGSDQVFNVGLGSAAVPGNLRGYLHVHDRLGRLPRREVLAPAARLGREGVVLNGAQAYFLALLRPIMTLTEAGRGLMAPGGRYLCEGDRYANPELGAFIEALAAGGDRELYDGEIARRIARDMDEGGGLLTEADLGAYRVIEREPLAVDYRGHRLLTNPPPSFGGALIGLSLRLLEPHVAAAFGSPSHLALMAAVMQEVDRQRAAGITAPGDLSAEAMEAGGERIRTASGGTTHVSVCDAEGNCASMTTSNGEGSGYIVPGTGVMLNNMMGEDDLHPGGFHGSPPGLRVSSMMSPSLLLQDGRVRLVLGSGGSKRIRTAILQVITHVVDYQMDLRQAVEAPRLHWDGECLQVEPGHGEAALDALARRVPVNAWSVRDVYFGGVHAVAPEGDAAGDPRRGGCVRRVVAGGGR